MAKKLRQINEKHKMTKRKKSRMKSEADKAERNAEEIKISSAKNKSQRVRDPNWKQIPESVNLFEWKCKCKCKIKKRDI